MKIKLLILTMLFIPIMFGCSKEEQLKELLIGEWCLYQNYVDSRYPWPLKIYTREKSPLHYIFYQENSYVLLENGSKKKTGEWQIIESSIEKSGKEYCNGQIKIDDSVFTVIFDSVIIGEVKSDILILRPQGSLYDQDTYRRY